MNRKVNKVGFWFGIVAFGSTAAFVLVQALQLFGILSYPFDEILIYGFSLCIVIPFLLEMLALHHVTPNDKKFWSHAALIFTIIYSVFVTANYVVQLATVIPMTRELPTRLVFSFKHHILYFGTSMQLDIYLWVWQHY